MNLYFSKQRFCLYVMFILGAILLSGCGNRLDTSSVGAAGPLLLFEDDFSDPSSGWEISSQGGIKDYYSGTYHIGVDDPNIFSWSVAGQTYGDVIIDVDMAFTGSAGLAEMGVICRMENNQDFYFLTIRSDGGYAIFKMYQGNEFFLGMKGYQHSDAVNTGLATNHMQVECQGEELALTVNGQELIRVRDASYQVGDVGLIAGAFSESDVNVFFDNFYVNQPE
ncbi:MAG: hypothetical protein JW757_13600 [Anaerolineales bacterium]|nr:hypothetical protein [Anaerolineales bacterium]